MECPNCHHWNEAGARFCEECGFELTAVAAQSDKIAAVSASAKSLPGSLDTDDSDVPEPPAQTLITASKPVSASIGYNGPRLVLNSTGSIFKLGDTTLIGREDPTLHIDFDGYPDAKYVSHHHAQIVKNDAIYYIEDLGSSNHTWVNGIKLSPGQSEPLREGAAVRFGKIELVFHQS